MSKLRFAETACARTRALAGVAALLLAAFVAAVLCMAAAPSQAYAYQYTVRVLGGNEGTVGASTVQMQNDDTKLGTVKDGIVSLQVDKGDFVKLDTGSVTLNDGSKYYVKGFRLSGQDAQHATSFAVIEDMDFVVSYGVQGDMVPYTLHFVEYQTGEVLADPITYYGNVGDKPVASFEYIPGYRPLYRNITGTLAASGNDFTFEYVALAEGETEQGTTTTTTTTVPGTTTTTTTPGTTTTVPGTTTTTTTTVGGNAATGNAAAGNAAAGGNEEGEGEEGVAEGNAAANAGANANAGAAPAAAQPATPPATEEILDTDNPLAQSGSTATDGGAATTGSAPLEGASNDQGIPMWVFWVIGIIVAAAAAGIAFFFYRRRRLEEEELFY